MAELLDITLSGLKSAVPHRELFMLKPRPWFKAKTVLLMNDPVFKRRTG